METKKITHQKLENEKTLILLFLQYFLVFSTVHFFINFVFLKSNHFPFVGLGPDDFSNLNYRSPFVSARPFSYLWVYWFSKLGELGFYIALNLLLSATCALVFFALSTLIFEEKTVSKLAVFPFAILLTSLDFFGEYTRLTGLIPNLVSVSMGYLTVIALCNEDKFKKKYVFFGTIALLQGLGTLAKEDFFHIPIVIAIYLFLIKPKTVLCNKNLAIKLSFLIIPPLLCVFFQKNCSPFLQGVQTQSSELHPVFNPKSIFMALTFYFKKHAFIQNFELFLFACSFGFLLIKRDKTTLFLLSLSLFSRFPYLLLPKHLLPHYFINWTSAETFLATYLFIRVSEYLTNQNWLSRKNGIIIGFSLALLWMPKLTSKSRSAPLRHYRKLAESHKELYAICNKNKDEINKSKVLVVIGNTAGYDLRSTPFDDNGAVHLANMGIKPKKWIRFIDPEKFPEVFDLVDWFNRNKIPCNIEIKSDLDAWLLCKKNKWPCIHYKESGINFIPN